MNTTELFRAARYRAEIARCLETIDRCELAAAIPPACCADVELFTVEQLALAQQARVHLANLRDELSALEGQREFLNQLCHAS